MKLTKIEQAKKYKDLVNLFLDEEFWISLEREDLMNLNLYVGKDIDESFKSEVENKSKLGKLEFKVKRLINRRPRSTKEIRDYLKFKQKLSESDIYQTIQSLESKGFLNDLEFAKWFIDQRMNFGVHGLQKIRSELISKGVEQEVVEAAFGELDDVKELSLQRLRDYCAKEMRNVDLTDYKAKQKFINKLLRKGFGYDEVNMILNQ